jgi:hypothetical protein
LHSSEEKIRIVLCGLRCEDGIAGLCRKEGGGGLANNPGVYWLDDGPKPDLQLVQGLLSGQQEAAGLRYSASGQYWRGEGSGRAFWKRLTGYHVPSRIEAKMRCLKAFGERIAARGPDRQTAEIQIRIALINRFNALGTTEIVSIA